MVNYRIVIYTGDGLWAYHESSPHEFGISSPDYTPIDGDKQFGGYQPLVRDCIARTAGRRPCGARTLIFKAMKQHQRTEGKSDSWGTPPELLARLGKFDLDPCAFPRPIKACATYSLALPFENGLKVDWSIGEFKARETTAQNRVRVWCNPPFNRYERPKWMEKMAQHGRGTMLIPAATETKAFKLYVWDQADAVCFVFGRPHFHYPDGTRAKANCGCSIVLVAYGAKDAAILEQSGLGKTLRLPLT